MLGVIDIPLDPVLVHLGPLAIHWYGIAYAVAFLVGIEICTPYVRSRGIPERDTADMFFWTILMGLVGGRLYFILQQPHLLDYLVNPARIIAVWEGGMAFFGAVILGLSTLAFMSYRKRLPLWVILDGGALFAGLPQAIGRLGNIINGDILGPPSNLPWAFRYTNPHTLAPAVGVPYQPANLYELLLALVMAGLVWMVLRRKAPVGTAIIIYLAAYSIGQFLLFFLRSTEPPVLFGLKQAQVTSLVVLFLAVPALAWLRRRYPGVWVKEAT